MFKSMLGIQPTVRQAFGSVSPTAEGGMAIKMINDTGAPTKKGTVVSVSFHVDFGFKETVADSVIPIGVIYEDNVPDGQPCLVVVSGIAEVLLKDNTPAVRGNWVGTSDTPGRSVAGGGGHPGTNPPAQAEHNREMGHCVQSKNAGVNVLAKCVLHFN